MGLFADKFRGFAFKSLNPFCEKLLEDYFSKMLHPKMKFQLKAQEEAASYIAAKMPEALHFDKLAQLHEYAMSKVTTSGLFLEFGVGTGSSINQFASLTKNTVHGFDSFEGLPEDWNGRHESKGAYSTKGQLPKVRKNVTLHKGWFTDTLPDFLKTHEGALAFLHLDADLYSSTIFALEQLISRIQPGTIIVFDEYFNYATWKEHEYKAFQEVVEKYKIRYTYLGFGYQQVVVRVESINV